MRVALDTNVYVALCRNEPEIVDRLEDAQMVYLPFFVIAELRAGFLKGNRSEQNERSLVRFLNKPEVHSLYPDEQTTHHYTRLYLQLCRQGTPVPVNDIWIAALVVQHDLILCSRDQHFDHLPQLLRS